MDGKTVTRRVADYIKYKNISVSELAAKLEIAEQKLTFANEVEMTATEFLEVCVELKVRPEQFRKSNWWLE